MKLLRVKEAAEILGLKCSSVRLLERRGILRAIRDWSDHRRFREDDVRRLKQRLLRGEEWR